MYIRATIPQIKKAVREIPLIGWAEDNYLEVFITPKNTVPTLSSKPLSVKFYIWQSDEVKEILYSEYRKHAKGEPHFYIWVGEND